MFRQEYPASPGEAFLHSGTGVFDNEQIILRLERLPSPAGRGEFTDGEWYGSAVEGWLKENPEGMEVLQRMFANWPFFRTLLSNMDMVMAKADLGIAARYSELVADVALREKIFSTIRGEFERTRKYLLAIEQEENFLADNQLLRRSIRNRFPYMDPLNHLQIEFLRRHRAGETDERLQRGIHMSINGIAAGLRNSG